MVRSRAVGLVVCVTLISGAMPLGMALCAPSSGYLTPVSGPIIKRFDPPLGPYASGHRGIDFGVPMGTSVVASNSGEVTFAGPVADNGFFITIAHVGEISTTYSFLSEIRVARGQRVRRGQPIALSGGGHGDVDALHFGAKFAGNYIDPELLLTGALDDISDLIALAPLDEPASAQDGIQGGGSSALSGSRSLGVRERGDAAGWSVRVGEKVANLGEAVVGSVRKAVSAAGGILSNSWNDVMLAAALTWDAIGGASTSVKDALLAGVEGVDSATRSSIDSIWESMKKAGRWFSKALTAAKNVTTASLKKWWRDQVRTAELTAQMIKWALAKLRSAAGAARDWVAAVVKKGWQHLRTVSRHLSQIVRLLMRETIRVGRIPAALLKGAGTFLAEMVKASVEQVKCSWKADAPPRLPTRDDLRRGVRPPPPPNENIVIAIAGIGSSTSVRNGKTVSGASMYKMDWETLGYSPDQIYHYSYRGIEERPGDGPYRLHAAYTKEDTYQPIEHSARELARQVREVQYRHPGRQIDLVAHSQGGVVAQYFVTHLYDRDDSDGPRIEQLITIASPHLGADAAQLGKRLSDSTVGKMALRGTQYLVDGHGLPPLTATSAQQMSEDSTFILALTEAWNHLEVSVTNIAATWDYVVTPPHSFLPGGRHLTVDLTLNEAVSSHTAVVVAPETRSYIYSVLGGSTSLCTPIRNALAVHGVGAIVSGVQDHLARSVESVAELLP